VAIRIATPKRPAGCAAPRYWVPCIPGYTGHVPGLPQEGGATYRATVEAPRAERTSQQGDRFSKGLMRQYIFSDFITCVQYVFSIEMRCRSFSLFSYENRFSELTRITVMVAWGFSKTRICFPWIRRRTNSPSGPRGVFPNTSQRGGNPCSPTDGPRTERGG